MKKIILLLAAFVAINLQSQTKVKLSQIESAIGNGYVPISTGTNSALSYTPVSSFGWQLLGNALGNNTSFIGSTDNRSFKIRTNNIDRVKVDSIGGFRWNPNNGSAINNFELKAYPAYTVIPAIYYGVAKENQNDNNYFALTDGHDMIVQTPYAAGNLILSKGNGSFFVRFSGDTTGVGWPTATFRAAANLNVPINSNIAKFTFNNNGGTQWVPSGGNSVTANYYFSEWKPDQLTSITASTLTNLYTAWFYARSGTSTNLTVQNQWGIGVAMSAHVTQSVLIGTSARTPSASLDVAGSGYFGTKLGMGIYTPSAVFHIKAGTIAAGTAPFKMTVTSASLMTTPEAGAVEVDASANLYYTPSATRYRLVPAITGSAALDFGSTAAGAVSDLTLTATGAVDGDPVDVGIPNASITESGVFYGWVSASNVVTVRFANNNLITAYDPASGTFKVTVFKN